VCAPGLCEVYLRGRVGPKVKDSIEDPFKLKNWLESVHDGLRVRVKGMTIA
jgi:hypothetical protein